MDIKFTGIAGRNGLDGLAADLQAATVLAPLAVRAVVQKSAVTIKRDWQARWSGHPKIRMLPNTITYDTVQTVDRVAAEIGPERGRRGAALASLIEYEFGGVHSSPILGGAPALEAEAPKFEKALGYLETRLLEGRR
jgi:hypothetical protein